MTIKQTRAIPRFVLLGGLLSLSSCDAQPQFLQTNNSPEANRSDPAAMQVVDRAIDSLGGKVLWNNVGGATADVEVKLTPTVKRNIRWSDEWGSGLVRFRRDSASNGTPQAPRISSDAIEASKVKSGDKMRPPHDNGVVALAVGYPGPALILSSSNYSCTFHFGNNADLQMVLSAESQDQIVVVEQCPAHTYPGSQAELVWAFSKSNGLPMTVALPVQIVKPFIVRMERVDYDAFQNLQGRMVPTQLRIKRISGFTDTLTLSNTSFVRAFADDLFKSDK